MEKLYKNCQSCGMPLKQDPKAGGTNVDGSKNGMYCSYCYENGVFTQPDITLQKMKELVKEQLIKMKVPRFLGGFFTMGLSNLERWKNK